MTYRKKLIEVALPLEAINVASAREKSIRHGHPSTLHLWWARRPLAACRAVLFASLIDDPSEHPEQFPTVEAQDAERQRLFRLIEELVKWENTNNERVLGMAREEIMKATGGNPPPVLDPFAGGGSIPLEAQRLGLEAHASDLNPVAVLINKALIEIPPRFANMPPVNPESRGRVNMGMTWKGAQGLAEDVRYYGKWMRDEAYKRIGHLYPKVQLPKEQGGGEATVIAWLWARTVKCPNPACGAQMPLVRSFALSTKAGKEAWVQPVVDRTQQPPSVCFEVRTGAGKPPGGTVGRRGATCLVCGTPSPLDYIRQQGQTQGMGAQLIAIVAEGRSGRVYVAPSDEHVETAAQAAPTWKPDAPLPDNARDIRPQLYGMPTYGDLFTPRQLVALTTFSDLVGEARGRVEADARAAGLAGAVLGLEGGGQGARAYSEAVGTYLGMGVSRLSDICNSLCMWENTKTQVRHVFTKQAIPMLWDYAEPNVFAEAAGDYGVSLDNLVKALLTTPSAGSGKATQLDATAILDGSLSPLISTDPPYYDNIGYADLSDFFYIWLRRSLNSIYGVLFSTMLVPKAQELVATPYRFGGSKEEAQKFFEQGLRQAFFRMRAASNAAYPVTVYYAFKQAEEEDDGARSNGVTAVASTGWETMLEGLLRSGFQVTGTWPMRSELSNRMIASGANALASSIVLVCRPRPQDAPLTTRREFINALRKELPHALKQLQHGNIAPVDLAQASIGPGMAVFSRYSRVLESSGEPMRVRTALELVNQALDAVLTEQESEYDAETRWAVAWFEQHAHNEGKYGDAETLSKAKNTAIAGLVEAGILRSGGGKVHLLRRDELSEAWDPTTDKRLTMWEVAQHLIRALDKGGEGAAAEIYRKVGGDYGEVARDLAYRLYSTCERKKWAQEALEYNSLVVAWPQIVQRAGEMGGEMAQSAFGV